ncbi:Competence protein ComM|nr:Competence protein ComM [Candidatus Pantoea persica]
MSNRPAAGESSASVGERVTAARDQQLAREGKINAHLNNREIRKWCDIAKDDEERLETILNQLGLSVRAWQRILRVACIIADLTGAESIGRMHLQEAMGYRTIDLIG